MREAFEEKKAKVLVAEGSGAARTQLTEVIRGLGFSDVSGVANLKDALGVLETENIDWLITSLLPDNPENGMHILKIFTEEIELRNLRVSFLLEESEFYVLPTAFEYGLFSWHRKPFTKDSLENELNTLLDTMKSMDWNSSLITANYLRGYLVDQGRHEEMLAFEKNLIDTFPSKADLLFNLVPPLMKLDRKDDAKSALRQIQLMDPSAKAKVDEVLKSHFDKGETLEVEGDNKVNFLKVENVVVVDSDSSIVKFVKESLAELGIDKVDEFSDGEEAANYIKENPDPGIVIQEWRIPKLAGPLFLQRVKKKGASATPVVVLSSLLTKENMPLVKEMGVAAILEKPLKKENFIKTLIWTVQQDRSPTEQSTMERKMRDLIASRDMNGAKEIKTKYISNDSIPQGMKYTIEAEFAFAEKDYLKARDFGIKAIKQAGDSIFVLNLLGKTLMNLREFELALKCFEKAQTLSPQNIDRICSIAEVQSEMGDKDAADRTIEEARKIDADNDRVDEAEAKVAVNAGDTEKAKEMMGKLDAIENVVSFMNNSAVAMANCDQVEEGKEQYRKTLRSIPDDKEETKAIVTYNLALAHARGGELEEAKIHLERLLKLKKSKVHPKAVSLLKRINIAIEKGVTLDLRLSKKTDNDKDNSSSKNDKSEESKPMDEATAAEIKNGNREVLATVQGVKGEMCCYLLYKPKDVDEKAINLIKKPPRFVRRSAIAREESHGADKVISSEGG